MNLVVEPARPEDAADVSRLLSDYLTRTELEKSAHGLDVPEELPERYRREIDHPAELLEHTLVARQPPRTIGLVIMRNNEIKRLWVDEQARGTGAGRALVEAALTKAAPGPVTLTVWDWRTAPIRLYRSLGFEVSPSWDAREHLICLTYPSR
ncbi:GNAT family N-acetyltransferase [Kineosporia succinea]|uniref:Acetyltransferase n=1 Tax=Kineosporia succinea TaxID=84632 RepID=A0ABT9NZQ1_9ACTN|nr:GNAT family N-acetyltransferase [Kineosporia succinea]MDP9825909.1 putative acetyltransferase [Kineosporia succinea]